MLGATTSLCARHAAANLTPEDIAALRAMVVDMEGLRAAGDHASLVRSNRRFHERICNAYPNQWAHDTLRRLWNYCYRVERRYPRSAERLKVGEREQRAIVAALAAGDADAAERHVREHAEAAVAALVRQTVADHGGDPGLTDQRGQSDQKRKRSRRA